MQIRTEFRNHILNMGIDPTDTKSIIDFISQDNLDEITKKCINFEKYLNDAYRYFKLKLEDFDQDFDFKNLIKI
jgi:hypothetical protein